MSQNAQPHFSLLSLSLAAASAAPISAESPGRSPQGPTANTTKHRRLSSAGRSRRRLSDARDAATRPVPTSLQTASASLAALSLSSPTMASRRPVPGAQPIQVPRPTSTMGTYDHEHASVDTHLSISPPQSQSPPTSNSISLTKSGRKRGSIFTCESCSKVYRHPSCLIKHRWEHTPQWREASKFVLSKHQQVQLLEAAAILSHLSPSSGSLPEDRSLWPSFLSGGLVPPPTSASNNDVGPTSSTMSMATATSSSTSASNPDSSSPISSSVPASTMLHSYRASPTGPQPHDYAVNGLTQIRPGVLGVPTAPAPTTNGKGSPVPGSAEATASMTTTEDDALNLLALRKATAPSSHARSRSYSVAQPRVHAHAYAHSSSYSHSRSASASASTFGFGFGRDHRIGSSGYAYASGTNGGWSLPRSSVRSKSGSSGSISGSRSASESRSDDEDEGLFEDADAGVGVDLNGGMDDTMNGGIHGPCLRAWKMEESEATNLGVRENEKEDAPHDKGEVQKSPGVEQPWDGMEMEMEMN